ncbi:MAG: transposase [Permianibacter sp.]
MLAHNLNKQVKTIELALQQALGARTDYQRLTAVNGIGNILALTILLETGDILRFPRVGDYTSYCRCVKTERLSNDKKKGSGNRKCGNKYLSWAYSEAAHFMLRYEPTVKRFYERKRQKTNGLVAIRATAHKIARAFYHVLRDQTAFDVHKAFP